MNTKKVHPHAEIIKAWLDDTSVKIEVINGYLPKVMEVKISSVINDESGSGRFRIKQADPYEELRKAQDDGKRVVFQNSKGEWEDSRFKWVFDGSYPPSRYKVAAQDISIRERLRCNHPEFDGVLIQITKSGIDGKISAKVVT